jgi:coenzyme F420-0:L-glutamate ligase / coenzyme F420-1:gamma-L-glutamate ligase
VSIEILPVRGLPEIGVGDDLAALLVEAADLRDGDVLVVAQKVVSKAEGALVTPRPGESRHDARRRIAVEQARRVVVDAPFAVVVETTHGFVCANGGIDASNLPDGQLALLPEDPDASARALRAAIAERSGRTVAVIVSDTFGRPWRMGQTDVALGVAGIAPIRDERGGRDRHGTPLEVTEAAIADELAGAADLVRRKVDGTAAVIVRGLRYDIDEVADATALLRPAGQDLFRRGRGALTDQLAARPDAADVPPGPVAARDLARALRAASRAADGNAELVVLPEDGGPTRVAIIGPPTFATGASAATLVAALTDLDYEAAPRRAHPGEPEAVIVCAGRRGDAHSPPPAAPQPGGRPGR